jgi:amino acid transporter
MSITDTGEKRIFLRKASGLIRTASLTDTYIFNFGLISLGVGVGTVLFYGPAFYPGANLWAATLIGGAVAMVLAWGMITWSIALPRSGGSYVFASRVLPPWLAVAVSFTEVMVVLFFCTVAAYWIVLLGISPMLNMLGLVTGSPGLRDAALTIIEPVPIFLIGSGILIIAALLVASGMRRYFFSQKVVFTIAVLSSLLLIGVLLSSSHEEFVANYNALFNAELGVDDAYNAIIASAMENGWTTEGATAWTTIKLANFPLLALYGALLSIFIGGEIKAVAKAQAFGMWGAISTSMILWIATLVLAVEVFGYDFLGGASYNFLGLYVFGFLETAVAPTADPTVTLLAGVASGNSVVITWLVSIGFICWIWMWIPAELTCAVRGFVAWSLDRVAPAALGYVSPRTHTPLVAIAVGTVINIIFMACLAFTTYAATIIIMIEALVLAWAFMLIGGVVFPFRRKELFEKTPWVGKTILGLPYMSVACGVSAIGMIFCLVILFFDPVAAGHDPVQLAIVGVVIAAGLVFYFVMKGIRSAQGVDIDQAFKEIPVE